MESIFYIPFFHPKPKRNLHLKVCTLLHVTFTLYISFGATRCKKVLNFKLNYSQPHYSRMKKPLTGTKCAIRNKFCVKEIEKDRVG